VLVLSGCALNVIHTAHIVMGPLCLNAKDAKMDSSCKDQPALITAQTINFQTWWPRCACLVTQTASNARVILKTNAQSATLRPSTELLIQL
jgi:hypothetical protein